MNIAVAHPVDLVLAGIRTILGNAGVGEISVCQSLADLKLELATRQPDIIVVGAQLEPELSVWEVIEPIQAVSSAQIVLLGNVSDGYLIQNLCEVGVMAYLYQYDSIAASLVEALSAVVEDRQYLSPTAMSEYLWAVRNPRSIYLKTAERRILRGLSRGERPKEIAAELGERTRYVYDSVERMRGRFGIASTQELVVLAVSENLL